MIKILNLKLVVLIVILIAILISKYKNIFAKGYIPNWSDSKFHCAVDILIGDLKGKETVETFYKKTFQKQIKKSLDLKK